MPDICTLLLLFIDITYKGVEVIPFEQSASITTLKESTFIEIFTQNLLLQKGDGFFVSFVLHIFSKMVFLKIFSDVLFVLVMNMFLLPSKIY